MTASPNNRAAALSAVVLLLALAPLAEGREIYQARFCREVLHMLLVIQGVLLAWSSRPGSSEVTTAASPSQRGSAIRETISAALLHGIITGVTGLLGLGLLQILTGASQYAAAWGTGLLAFQAAILTVVQFAALSRVHPLPASLITLLVLLLGLRSDLPAFASVLLPDFAALGTRAGFVFEEAASAPLLTHNIAYHILYMCFLFSILTFPRSRGGVAEPPERWALTAWLVLPALGATLLALACADSLRKTGGNLFWLIASEYHHTEPSRAVSAVFPPGTAARLELIPPLRAALFCDPAQLETRLLLGDILLSAAGNIPAGTAILEQGSRIPSLASEAHRFPASLALAALERHRLEPAAPFIATQALAWLDQALSLSAAAPASPTAGDVFHPAQYHQLRAVILIGLKRHDEAITAWERSGERIASSTDLAALYLYAYTKGEPLPSSPADLRPLPARQLPESTAERNAPEESRHDDLPAPGSPGSRHPARPLALALLALGLLSSPVRRFLMRNPARKAQAISRF
ncbi:MAG TPA: hypothetical protein PLP29_11500 [Candidatus Ozemobacteraceae bacterium]|nr:hypothetical protein [Candidatus Ozemobacteraceae bacterium]